MELGQALFGNGTQSFEIRRGEIGDLFLDFLEKVGLTGYGHPTYEGKVFCDDPNDRKTFDNGTFLVRPYYWGDCDCGYEERANAVSAANPHATDCFHAKLNAVRDAFDERNKGRGMESFREREALSEAFCASHGVPMEGCLLHCTCGRKAVLEAFAATPEGDHAPTCNTALPNFVHRPSNLVMHNYKYFFRGVTANRDLTVKDMNAVVANCLASLGPDHDTGKPRLDTVGTVQRTRALRSGHVVCEIETDVGTTRVFVPSTCRGSQLVREGVAVAVATGDGKPNRVARLIEAHG